MQWVRNLRAAGAATLNRGRRSEAISVSELPAREAAPVLKQYLLHGAQVGAYFDATSDSPLEAFAREAPRHPVFQITPMESLPQERSRKEALFLGLILLTILTAFAHDIQKQDAFQ